MSWDQIVIVVFGVTAIWLSQDPRPHVARYACLCGLASQPGWFVSAFHAEQWGVFFVAFLYTFSWLRGLWSRWLRAPVIKWWNRNAY